AVRADLHGLQYPVARAHRGVDLDFASCPFYLDPAPDLRNGRSLDLAGSSIFLDARRAAQPGGPASDCWTRLAVHVARRVLSPAGPAAGERSPAPRGAAVDRRGGSECRF